LWQHVPHRRPRCANARPTRFCN